MLARVEVRETSWTDLLGETREGLAASSPEVAGMRDDGRLFEVEATVPVNFVMIHCIGSPDDIQAFYDYFAPADRGRIWRWGFDGKVDFDTEYTGQHNDILATQPGGSTFENPGWSHNWLGQGNHRFARSVTRAFGKDYA